MSESHTATHQWQSFEMRMRRRRADRCAIRAAVALEAGVLDDARAALDEALYLSPDDPELHELAARLEAAERELSVPVPGERPSRRWLGMAAALILLSGAGGWLWMQADGAVIGRLAAGVDGVVERAAAAIRSIELPEIRLPLSTSNATTPSPGSPPQAPAERTARHEPSVAVSQTAIAVPETSGTLPGPAAEAPIAASPAPAGAQAQAPPPPAEPPASGAATRGAREVATAGTSPATAADRAGRETAQSGDSPARAPTAAAAARGTTPSPLAAVPPVAGSTRAETARGPAGIPTDAASARARESAAASSTVPARDPVTPAVSELASLRSREPATPAVNALPGSRSAEPSAPPIAEPATPQPAALSPIPPAAAASRSLPAPVATSGGSAAVSAEQGVRATLSRYEAAYSGLDAAAASAVWPSVDRRALARAFEDLQSQSVSLSKCDVKVNGGSAQADCTGSARWTPRVGSGSQSASRRWRFELRDTGGTWIITQATVR